MLCESDEGPPHAGGERALDGEPIGFGAAAGEGDGLRAGANQGRDFASGALDGRARQAPRGVHRGGIAADGERAGGRGCRFRADRGRCVVVEVDLLHPGAPATEAASGRFAWVACRALLAPRSASRRPFNTSASDTLARKSSIRRPVSSQRSWVRQRAPPCMQPSRLAPPAQRVARKGSSTAVTTSAIVVNSGGRASR